MVFELKGKMLPHLQALILTDVHLLNGFRIRDDLSGFQGIEIMGGQMKRGSIGEQNSD